MLQKKSKKKYMNRQFKREKKIKIMNAPKRSLILIIFQEKRLLSYIYQISKNILFF